MTTAAERTASHQPISPSSGSHVPIPPSSGSHVPISPSILYFGTPVALLTTENPDGTDNLAPISSAWALGRTLVLGIGAESRTAANLADRPELAVSLPSPHQWAAVNDSLRSRARTRSPLPSAPSTATSPTSSVRPV